MNENPVRMAEYVLPWRAVTRVFVQRAFLAGIANITVTDAIPAHASITAYVNQPKVEVTDANVLQVCNTLLVYGHELGRGGGVVYVLQAA